VFGLLPPPLSLCEVILVAVREKEGLKWVAFLVLESPEKMAVTRSLMIRSRHLQVFQ
jgi:hypothetical protein